MSAIGRDPLGYKKKLHFKPQLEGSQPEVVCQIVSPSNEWTSPLTELNWSTSKTRSKLRRKKVTTTQHIFRISNQMPSTRSQFRVKSTPRKIQHKNTLLSVACQGPDVYLQPRIARRSKQKQLLIHLNSYQFFLLVSVCFLKQVVAKARRNYVNCYVFFSLRSHTSAGWCICVSESASGLALFERWRRRR